MKTMVVGNVVVFLLATISASAQEAKLGKPIDFANAGIQMAFPDALAPTVSLVPDCLCTRSEKDGNDVKATCNLLATLPADANYFAGVEKLAKAMAEESGKRAGVISSVEVSSVAVTVADKPGWRIVRRMEEQRKGPQVDVLTVWSTEPETKRPRFVYTLMFRAKGSDSNKALATAAAVCQSAKVIPMVPAVDLAVSELGASLAVRKHGFSIRVPEGWYAFNASTSGDGGYHFGMGARDYRTTGHIPMCNVLVSSFDGTYPTIDQKVADNANQECGRKFGAQKYAPLSAKVIQFAGRPAVEMTGTLEGEGGTQMTAAIRQVYNKGRVYDITMTVLGKDEKRAVELLDKVTAGFRLLDAEASAKGESPQKSPDAGK